jgi:hypothetical protein
MDLSGFTDLQNLLDHLDQELELLERSRDGLDDIRISSTSLALPDDSPAGFLRSAFCPHLKFD